MKAAILYGVKDLRIEDIAVPEVKAGEVLVKVKAATTCGTDLKILQRGYTEKIIKLPTVFGHEWSGIITEVGEGLEWPKKGARVRAGNSAPCLRCTMCQKGDYNLCEDMIWLWGAYADYMKIPTRTVMVNMQEIPVHISFEEASITEPLACVLHGVEETDISFGDSVTIIGAGPIGLLHLLTAKKMGASKVICVDLAGERLDIAGKLGADETVNAAEENVVESVRDLTGGYGSDVVVEAVGQPATWQQALRLVRRGGTVLEFGGCPLGTRIDVDTELLHYGEVTVRGAFHAKPVHFKKALHLIASRSIDVRPLVTKRMKLDEIWRAFEILSETKSEIKIAIIP